uniref:Uncharacterized protein n=1 Tax=Arundo donax TaxID=35708 RepID=A0A0A9H415_ARUDO
MLCTPTPLMC